MTNAEHHDAPGITAELSAWTAGLSADEVPPAVRSKTAQLLLDGLGCGLQGSTTPWGRTVRDLVLSNGGQPEATVWGSGVRVPATQAPLANATFMHSFEFDDLHAAAVLHGAAQVLPVVLAASELRATSHGGSLSAAGVPSGVPTAADVIAAAVAGLEVGARVGLATGAEQLRRGFHPSPNTGLFSAAAVAARLLELDEAATAHAFGIAASSGGFLMAAQYGAMVKRMHPGRAAQAGVVAALLAARGFTGIQDVLEEPYGGFARAYAGLQPDALSGVVADLGNRWETLRFSIKAYPCCGSNHTAIDAYRALASRRSLGADDIESIEVACSTLTADHVGWAYAPNSVTSAQMNLAYTLAVLITDGDVFVDQFQEDRLADPRVLDVVAKIRIHADPDIDAQGREARHLVRLAVATTDGQHLTEEVRHARGSEHHPLTDAEAREKYHKLAQSVLPEDLLEELADSVLALKHGDPSSGGVEQILDALARSAAISGPAAHLTADEARTSDEPREGRS